MKENNFYNRILILLDDIEKNTSSKKLKWKLMRWTYYILLPFSQIIERLLYKHFWEIILSELLTNEPLVQWLDENEFGLEDNRLWKKDIVGPDTFLYGLTQEELVVKIKGEFTKVLFDKISEVSTIDVENYINLFINVEMVKGEGGARHKVYTVIIRYYRWYVYDTNKKKLVWWLLKFIGIAVILWFGIPFVLDIISNFL